MSRKKVNRRDIDEYSRNDYYDKGLKRGRNGFYDPGRYPDQNGYANQRGYTDQNGYANQRGYKDLSGYANQGGYKDPNEYPGQNGYTNQRGYADQDEYSPRHRRPHSEDNLTWRPVKKKKKGCGCFTPVFLLFLAAIVLAVLLFLLILKGFSRVENEALDPDSLTMMTDDPNIKDYQNIVLFGVDDQDNKIRDIGSRTDSIIIASINKHTRDVKLLSIYRDTYVSIDGNYDKINAAYAFGGPELAIRTINRNLDLNISDYATVNFKALADAVDVLGGIELTIKTEKELKNLNDYIGNMNKINGGDSKKFDAVGTYTFDGNQAVAYSRIRYMEGGDHERSNHQRLVVDGILRETKKQPWKIPQLTAVVLPQCRTSLSGSEFTKLAATILLTDITDSKAYPFDSVDARYMGIYYGFAKTVRSNAKEAHLYLFGTEDYQVSEELGKISDKVKYITDANGF